MDKYLKLLDKLKTAKIKLIEIKHEISNYGCQSFQVTDMPKGKGGSSDRLEDLIDKEMLLGCKIQGILIAADMERRELERRIKNIKNPRARVVFRLKYICGLDDGEIMNEANLSYWAMIKLFKRYS